MRIHSFRHKEEKDMKNRTKRFSRVLSVVLCVVMIFTVLPVNFAAFAATTLSTTSVLYTPSQSGQLLAEGEYYIYNSTRACVLVDSVGANGIVESNSVTLSGDQLTTSTGSFVTVTVADAANNLYYFKTPSGYYISIGDTTTLSASPVKLKVSLASGYANNIIISNEAGDRYYYSHTEYVAANTAGTSGRCRQTLYKKALVSPAAYVKYTPRASGQIVENGRYIIYCPEQNGRVFTGTARSGGGVNSTQSFTISGNTITTDASNLVTITCTNTSNNYYNVVTSAGKYVFVGTSNTVAQLTLNDTAQNVRIQYNSSYPDRVMFTNTSNANMAINHYDNTTYFGVWNEGFADANNRQILYKETVNYYTLQSPHFAIPVGSTVSASMLTQNAQIYQQTSPTGDKTAVSWSDSRIGYNTNGFDVNTPGEYSVGITFDGALLGTIPVTVFAGGNHNNDDPVPGHDEGTISAKADPSTSDISEEFPLTENEDGKVFTDKSVVYMDDDFNAFSAYNDDEFAVELSAKAQSYTIEEVEENVEYEKAHADVVFVVDVSGSMGRYNMAGSSTTRAEGTAIALNKAINQMLDADPETRIGIVCYGSGYYPNGLYLPIDKYTLAEGDTDYVTYAKQMTTGAIQVPDAREIASGTAELGNRTFIYFDGSGESKKEDTSKTRLKVDSEGNITFYNANSTTAAYTANIPNNTYITPSLGGTTYAILRTGTKYTVYNNLQYGTGTQTVTHTKNMTNISTKSSSKTSVTLDNGVVFTAYRTTSNPITTYVYRGTNSTVRATLSSTNTTGTYTYNNVTYTFTRTGNSSITITYNTTETVNNVLKTKSMTVPVSTGNTAKRISTSGNLVNSKGQKMAATSYTVDNDGTFTQAGLKAAENMFLSVNTELDKRIPVIVLITDGTPTFFDNDYVNVPFMNDTSKPNGNGTTAKGGNGNVNNCTNQMGYLTIRTAMSVKDAIDAHYNTTNPEDDFGSLFYSIGPGVDYLFGQTVLDPSKTNLDACAGNTTTNEQSGNGTPDGLRSMIIDNVGQDHLDYVDFADWSLSGNMSLDELSTGFSQIIKSITDIPRPITTSYTITEQGVSATGGSYVEFTDYLGNGMEVRGEPVLRYGNVNYPCTGHSSETGSGKTTDFYYFNYNVTEASTQKTVSLSNVTLRVVTDNSTGKKTLYWRFPAELLPTVTPEYDMATDTTTYHDVAPIRVLFKLGVEDSDTISGTFYTNDPQQPAHVEFTPMVGNPYYYDIVTDSDGTKHAIWDYDDETVTNDKTGNPTNTKTYSYNESVNSFTGSDGSSVYNVVHELGNNGVITIDNFDSTYMDTVIDKTADGTKLTSTGTAEVSLTASSLPLAKNIDVLFVTDLSNSMYWKYGTNANATGAGDVSKLDVLQEAVGTFTDAILENNSDLTKINNNTVSFVTFGGIDKDYVVKENVDRSSNKPTSRYADVCQTLFTSLDDADEVKEAVNDIRFAYNNGNIYLTFDGRDGSADTTCDLAYGLTVYDHGFMEAEKAIAQIKKNYADNYNRSYDNSSRQIYIIFVTDGAPTHWNGHTYTSRNSDTTRVDANEQWLTLSGQKELYTYDNLSTDAWYNYIASTPNDWATRVFNTEKVSGMSSIAVDPANGGFGTIQFTPQSGYDLRDVLKNIVDGEELDVILADDSEQLSDGIMTIMNEFSSNGSDAYVIDTMGSQYDLQMAATVTRDGEELSLEDYNVTPFIKVSSYEFEKEYDEYGNVVSLSKKEGAVAANAETVTFNAAGTEAYSDQLDGNIMTDGVICAKYFTYNTNKKAVTLADGTSLAAESFKWDIGAIPNNILELSYLVYLTGSMEGTRPEGVYETNEEAIIYYTDNTGEEQFKIYPVPELEWDEGKLAYELYLVNEDGTPIDEDGKTVSFEDRTVMSELVEVERYLNTTTVIDYDELMAIIPDGYELYNPNTSYTEFLRSEENVSEAFINDNTSTTKIFDPTGTSVDTSGKVTGLTDFTDVKVAFAIVKRTILGPDIVVIDYGLPVEVDALGNDVLGAPGAIAGIASSVADDTTLNTERYSASRLGSDKVTKAGSYLTLKHGKASFNGDTITYVPTDMQMTEVEVIYYEYATEGGSIYYTTVTVVPATIMYYEDDFVTFNDTLNNKWTVVTGEGGTDTQAQDRPGESDIAEELDANNVYGYDEANVGCTTYSLGSAHYVTVKNGDNLTNAADSKWPTAVFTFTGTAFDLISSTTDATGWITVDVYEGTDTTAKAYKNWHVDTYYGFSRQQDGYMKHEWHYDQGRWHVKNTIVEETAAIPESQKLPSNIENIDTDKTYITYEKNYIWVSNTKDGEGLYQIPVIKSPELPYNTYTVVVSLKYSTLFDHHYTVGEDGKRIYKGEYDFCLDAIRTYAPAENYDDYNREYYTKDQEGWPQFIELRKNLINEAEVSEDGLINGVLFIETLSEGNSTEDYKLYGPNNEIYLAPGQAISLSLQRDDNSMIPDAINIGAKMLFGEEGQLSCTSIDVDTGAEKYQGTVTINTTGDMYYKACSNINWDADGNSDLITITNTGENHVSVTNLKITYKEAPVLLMTLGGGFYAAPTAVKAAQDCYFTTISSCEHQVALTVLEEPTEDTAGLILAECEDCGLQFLVHIPNFNSNEFVISSVDDPTLEEEGRIVYTWTSEEYGDVEFTVVIPKLVEEEHETEPDTPEQQEQERGIIAFFKSLFNRIRELFARLFNIF